MVNKVENDCGELVYSVGAPGSMMDAYTRFPKLISDVRKLQEWAIEDGSEITSVALILSNYLYVNKITLSLLEIDSLESVILDEDKFPVV